MMENFKQLLLEDVCISKNNPRRHFNEKKILELVESIKEKGVIEPIIVRPKGAKYEIVCGERRYRASQKASKKDIPALIRELSDAQALEFQVVENLQREDLHPLEEAEGYEVLLKKYGYKAADEIAAKIGKSRSYIYGRLKLCDLIPENRKLFYGDKFSPSTALLVARIPKELQKEAGKDIAKGGYYSSGEPMSYRRAHEHIVENYMLRLKEAPFDTKDAKLGGKGPCSNCQKRTGNQRMLFPDISSADVCTDPTCFKMKKNAFVQRTIDKAKEAGKKVLSLNECKKLFPSEYTESLSSGAYVNLKDTCYEAKGYPKYSSLIKGLKDIEIIYAVHPKKGHLIKLVSRTALSKGLKNASVKLGSGNSDSKYRVDQAKARKAERIRKITSARIAGVIVEKINTDKGMTFLRILGDAIIRKTNFDAERMFAQRRDPSIKGEKVSPMIKKHFKEIADSEIFGFCLELLMLGDAVWGSSYGDTISSLAKHYKVDTKKVSLSVKKEIETKGKKRP